MNVEFLTALDPLVWILGVTLFACVALGVAWVLLDSKEW